MIGRTALLAGIIAAGLGSSGCAQAQSYPNRPIKLVVPVLPGGTLDVMARLVAQQLSSSLGPVFVENRAGAGTTLGAKAVATADPDGYTLLLGSAGTNAIGPMLYKSAGYDPLTSFAPVAFVSSVPYVMIASPALPVRTVQELVAYAKANPGKLSFGVPNAAPPHMLAAWFKALTGTDILIVPYKGTATVLTDLLGGQIQLGFETTSVLVGHLHDDKIRALAAAAPARLPDLPEVPTMIESGFPISSRARGPASWRRLARRRTSSTGSMPRSMQASPRRRCRHVSSSSPPRPAPEHRRTSRPSSRAKFQNGRRWPSWPA
jgi:tripartite-type tricarboxylate transporter receptor subunit TctC